MLSQFGAVSAWLSLILAGRPWLAPRRPPQITTMVVRSAPKPAVSQARTATETRYDFLVFYDRFSGVLKDKG